ncbi:MAG: hypothetical protein ACM3QZ_11270, partial [Solirubrobacterales bacterium]
RKVRYISSISAHFAVLASEAAAIYLAASKYQASARKVRYFSSISAHFAVLASEAAAIYLAASKYQASARKVRYFTNKKRRSLEKRKNAGAGKIPAPAFQGLL